MKRFTPPLIAASCVISLCGCAPSTKDISHIMSAQADSWNRGDVDAFMDPYWHSEKLSFSGSRGVTRGWQSVLTGYQKRYPTRSDMGTLTFSNLEVRELGRNAALVLGRWQIDRGKPIGGVFSLVWRKTADGWVIVHDHTSVDDTPNDVQK